MRTFANSVCPVAVYRGNVLAHVRASNWRTEACCIIDTPANDDTFIVKVTYFQAHYDDDDDYVHYECQTLEDAEKLVERENDRDRVMSAYILEGRELERFWLNI